MNKKKIMSYGMGIIVLLSVFAMVMPVSAQGPSADWFGVEDASGNTGDYVEVPVNINNTKDGPIQTIKFDVIYNHSVIKLDYDNDYALSEGDLTTGPQWTFTLGTNEYSVTLTTGKKTQAIPNGSTGSVVLLNFSVIETAGTSPMNMSKIDFASTDFRSGTAPAKNGTFYVEVISPPYLVNYTISNRTITPPQTTEIDVEFSEEVEAWISIEDLDGNLVKQLYHSYAVSDPTAKTWDGTCTESTDVPDGDYVVNVTGTSTTTGLSVVNNTEVITVMPTRKEGDVNNDRFVDTTDAQWVLQMDAGRRAMPAIGTLDFDVTDVNDDGFIDTTDAQWILQYDAGRRTSL